jgi:hypothetical protein
MNSLQLCDLRKGSLNEHMHAIPSIHHLFLSFPPPKAHEEPVLQSHKLPTKQQFNT